MALNKLLTNFYRKYLKKKSRFAGKSPEETFGEIYKTNYWKGAESVSGKGSDLDQTQVVIEELNRLIKQLELGSLLDIPCGDFLWMQHVNLGDIQYYGADIVDELIKDNQQKFKADNLNFSTVNLIKDPLPSTDMIFTRDCLVHLSYDDIYHSLKNIKSSGFEYILTTTFVDRNTNEDIITGSWRAINLQIEPFNFPTPIELIDEQCTQGNGKYRDKHLGLWKVDDITLPSEAYKE